MIEEVYDFLRQYGFSKEELETIENINDKIFFVSLNDIKKNIDFLLNKGLNKDEILDVFRKNIFMITVAQNRLKALDNIYVNNLEFDISSLKQLIKNNPEIYTLSPIELQKIIDYLKEHNYNIGVIRDFILKNSKIISMEFNEFIKLLKVN